jgi:mycothiol synthase
LLRIRPFVKGCDEAAFVRIYNAAFSDYDDIRNMTLEEMKKLEASPSFDDRGMFIAEWNGEPVGAVDAYIDKMREEEKGFIQSLGVIPSLRRMGIGMELVERALESLRQRGMKTAEAWAQTGREGCMRVYRSFGFKEARTNSMMKRTLQNIQSNIGENKEITIRSVRPKDEEDIKLLNRLDNEAFKEHFNFRPRTIEETKYTLFEMPWFNVQNWFLALLNEKPVGYVCAAIDEGLNKEKSLRWGWILDIGVLKPYRRKGIGARLMLHSMQLLKEAQMEDALLYVDDMNPTNAIRLYKRLGFKVARKNIIYQLELI